ncbi:MAG TPA: DUF2283 domain-containing protein [Candidatus Nanoarchaeia archaeon]|nr:DUF2283 domain-containing protein [Candidatus Nanoarchaeia archaeon]
MKQLNKPGEFDYDFKNDIFFFKVKNREYSHSIELGDLVIDFDEENFIVGLQIFNAKDFFNITKNHLKNLNGFRMNSIVKEGIIKIELTFGLLIRNKSIEYKPIIYERIDERLPNSELSCAI